MLNKTKRLLTSLLPVDPDRTGACNRCGACCKLPYPCPFLRFDDQGLSRCAVYAMRPPSCRKYPRVAAEQMTPQECGYSFATADARVTEAIGRDPLTDPL
ncbi:hypothetical protein [Thiocapsa rosea]|uniref:Uncharacterized protein n=1 Tax=Thiocapsa rosea TaxID=69360 RepID=A0A495V7B3_9GAMM|nr:hypothetical protein [Thiocapsa rosea]RKT45184.1 hypothetical protein BDD21_2601 [Thiocapsa rosea]